MCGPVLTGGAGAIGANHGLSIFMYLTTGDTMADNERPPKNAPGLRLVAEQRLREGTAPPNRGWTISCEALACLHELASNQASAADAMKFLHELQVYQVELDLQHEQHEQNQAETVRQLERYAELFERVAVGLLSLDADGVIIDANPRAAALLHVEAGQLPGRRLDSYLAPASRSALVNTLARLNAGAEERSCVVLSGKGQGVTDSLRLTATRSQDGRSRLVALAVNAPEGPVSVD